ncbi:acyl carrier protein [Vibrio sp. 10N.286.49.B3]|uniref:phosphopantetheine-binding protein n=1 Tax=Vibrio sp. 10N.286.49.B3 TaxID=1880855 RepID=UPI000C8596C5|nr:phosphopantetheine-binding protein [Vibrio sp. 10N.286.49.B3]PMH44601.1 acyl carrier protein [Vibrio sp. 10N.286.49.B3]
MKTLENKIKQLIIDALNLEDLTVADIEADEPLFGDEGGLNLDSIDALELGLAIKQEFGVVINGDDPQAREYFKSVRTLSQLVEQQAEAVE